MVVRGFFADIINRIPVAELQVHLMQAVERELAGAGLAEVGPPDEPTLPATLTPTSDPRTADR